MTLDKLYVVATADIARLNALCQAGVFKRWQGVFEGSQFIGVLEPRYGDFAARESIAALPGFTVLPSHHDPQPLSTSHLVLLQPHGVAVTDSMWHAAHKLAAKFQGAGGTPHALRPDR
ncbi:MAG: hypothetical protein ACR2KS_10090 [Candidatus Eremiobacter antarcticus]|nr:hypothetical protein [Candidatus Eremiobacteraeota bacterium]MBC5808783.1 hypothetical protein [Candidatus Eremiobacteraeota bacterium]